MKSRLLPLTILCLCLLAFHAAATTYYVDINSPNPTPPYSDWSTAATNIQDAIDASSDGDLILVTNGVYATGGRTINGFALTNRVVIDKAVTVESVNGPLATVVEGYQVPGTTNGSSAVRCVYMTNNAVLIGFTLASGATLPQSNGSDELHDNSGGGVWCENLSSTVSNCVLSADAADYTWGVGGGSVYGTFYNCTFTGNSASAGGGAYGSTLNNCTLTNNFSLPALSTYYPGIGGGALSCSLNQCFLAGNGAPTGAGAEGGTLNFCVVTNNSASGSGGGVGHATLNGCLVSGNSAGSSGGGTCFCSITNCTLVNNTSADSGGASYSDTLNSCTLSNNVASDLGGGAYSSSLTNCDVANNSALFGGGAYSGTLYNCILSDNIATSTGGGVDSVTAFNSALTGNFALNDGGGAAGSTMASCTLTGNSAFSGGGAYSSELTNCIVYYNSGIVGTNYDAASSLSYCCTTPLPIGGANNISEDPMLADGFHLSSDSSCIGAGNEAAVIGVDIDGDSWANPPAIGCDEFYSSTATGQLSVAIDAIFTNLAAGFAGNFTAQINGHAAMCYWDLGDGTQITNQPYVSHAWTSPGEYPVSLWAFNQSNPGGVNATIMVQVANQPVQYVSQANPNPVAPFLSWATAATNIQDAVDAAYEGGVILVSNGVYQTSGRTAFGALTNRLTIIRPSTVESVNGPAVTTIEGYQIPGSINGQSAVRGAWLGDGAELVGFTITGGATMEGFNVNDLSDADGGGIYCQSTNVMVLNCIISSNSCGYAGAGICSGTAIGCQIVNNTNQGSGSYGGGGGAAYGVLLNDTVNGNSFGSDGSGGAGAFSCILSNCVIDSNTMGGVLSCTLNNCTVANNINVRYAGGADLSTLNNCLVCNNQGGQLAGGGAYDCTLNSCVISNNFSSTSGGGVYYDSSQTNVLGQQNIVVGNTAANPGTVQGGGGVYLGINATLDNWTFVSNSAAGSGGGIYVSSSAIILNCTFQGNSSGGNGGGVGLANLNPNLISVSNCTFVANIASGSGGGAYAAALTNCDVIGNEAANGGGVYGTVNNCVLDDNSATNDGGGLYYFNMNNSGLAYPFVLACAFTNNFALNGGGAYAVTYSTGFSNCTFYANSATNSGGGIDGSGMLTYCILSDNSAQDGGGACNTPIVNCLLSGNSAAFGGGAYYISSPVFIARGSTIADNNATTAGGGFYWAGIALSGMTNCIIYDNSAPSDMNYPPANYYGAYYCCTVPLPSTRTAAGNNNITNDPSFMNASGGDFQLSPNSPCINSGDNAATTGSVDLNGNPRIVGGIVDIGAYEFQTPVSNIPYAWLYQYGLPIVAGIDTSNLDGTAFNVYQDWIAGLNPTNPASVLAMLTPKNTSTGVTIAWQSVTGIPYFLQRSTNLLAQPFSTIQSNITGQTNKTSYTDTSATNNVPYFYRVGVVAP